MADKLPVARCAFRYTFNGEDAKPGKCKVCGRTLAELKDCPDALAVRRYLEGERDGQEAEAKAAASSEALLR